MNLNAEINLLGDKYNVDISIGIESSFATKITITYKDNFVETFSENIRNFNDYPQIVLRHIENHIYYYLVTLRKKKLERICQS